MVDIHEEVAFAVWQPVGSREAVLGLAGSPWLGDLILEPGRVRLVGASQNHNITLLIC